MELIIVLQIIISGISVGSIYALIGVCMTVALNASSLVNSLHGEFVVLGGILCFVFYKYVVGSLPVAILLAILAVTFVGAVVERMLVAPMVKKGASLLLVMILTLGATNVFWSMEFLLWGWEPVTLPHFSSVAVMPLLGAVITTQNFWVLGIAAVAVALLQVFYTKTKLGQALLACSINRDAASLMGINVGRMVMISFAASGALGAVAGVAMTSVSYMRYDLGLGLLLKAFAASIIGGMGNVVGAIVGGVILGLLESVSTGIVEAGYRDAISFSLVILMLLFWPRGLFGSHLIED